MSVPRNRFKQVPAPVVPTLDQLGIALAVFDGAFRCVFVSDAARALFDAVEPLGADTTALFSSWAMVPDFSAETGTVSTAHHNDGRVFRCETREMPGGVGLVLTDISSQMLAAERAAQDPLTGLAQRVALKERLAEIIALAQRDDLGAAVHYIDLDRFKGVNDTLGHAVGDQLLVKVAERLRSTLDKGDVAARLGGDEFVVVQCRCATPAEAQARAIWLADLVGRTYAVQGHLLNIGASVGTALFPSDGPDPDSLLRHADLALYRAKADGRGVCRFYEPAMNARLETRRLLEKDLRKALAARQFHLTFQPLVALQTDQVSGFEALLRWHHPERGLVSPADFIPLAEEIGLISSIGEWVLRTACREAASWPIPATIAVNISPMQFKSGKLAELVVSALTQAQLPASRLELEITESALLDETNLVLKTLNTLRDLGVRIAMDDFGTGYSSLSYLRKFPFDKIKIDRSFVDGLGRSGDCEAIVKAVTSLGASLGMRITAEGVETAEQLARIRQEGCTEVQGYLTGKPMTAQDVATLLERQMKG